MRDRRLADTGQPDSPALAVAKTDSIGEFQPCGRAPGALLRRAGGAVYQRPRFFISRIMRWRLRFWLSVSTFFLPANGFSPSRNSMRIGVPSRR